MALIDLLVKHPYHYSAPFEERYESWDDFIAELGGMDEDYNLLFRWDLRGKEWYDDDDFTGYRIELSYVQQRKGGGMGVTVEVTEEDEPKIRAYLTTKLSYLLQLWTPITQEAAR